jgi:putative exosortase-associated protein (TIGR04073 family)
MRNSACAVLFLFMLMVAAPVSAEELQKPESIVGKMAFKLVRGVTNIGTGIVELPKQSYLSVRDTGKIGYVVGPLKGIGMTAYRVFIGAVETVAFLVPQPGYYDEMIDPEFVWNGWEERRSDRQYSGEAEPAATPVEKKGE